MNRPEMPMSVGAGKATAFGEIETRFSDDLSQLSCIEDRLQCLADKFLGSIPSPTSEKDTPKVLEESLVGRLNTKLSRFEYILSNIRELCNRLEEL